MLYRDRHSQKIEQRNELRLSCTEHTIHTLYYEREINDARIAIIVSQCQIDDKYAHSKIMSLYLESMTLNLYTIGYFT